jgi:hypothetical protein
MSWKGDRRGSLVLLATATTDCEAGGRSRSGGLGVERRAGMGSSRAVGRSRESRTMQEPSYCGRQIPTRQKSRVGSHRCVLRTVRREFFSPKGG